MHSLSISLTRSSSFAAFPEGNFNAIEILHYKIRKKPKNLWIKIEKTQGKYTVWNEALDLMSFEDFFKKYLVNKEVIRFERGTVAALYFGIMQNNNFIKLCSDGFDINSVTDFKIEMGYRISLDKRFVLPETVS